MAVYLRAVSVPPAPTFRSSPIPQRSDSISELDGSEKVVSTSRCAPVICQVIFPLNRFERMLLTAWSRPFPAALNWGWVVSSRSGE